MSERPLTTPAEPLRIWRVDLDDVDDDAAILSHRERERAALFVRPLDGRRFVQAHCALRRILASATAVDAAGIAFAHTNAGKPLLSEPFGRLDFSLSHCGPIALIAVNEAGRVGVDVEAVRDIDDIDGVAEQVFTPSERATFGRAQPADRCDLFYDLWTRKEAVLKANGRGFIDDPRTLELGVGPKTDADGVLFAETPWTVVRLRAGTGVRAAVAVEGVVTKRVPPPVRPYRARKTYS